MKLKRFGRTGLKVSEICLGTGTFGGQADQEASFAIMDRVWEAGVTFFDVSNMYPLSDDLTTRDASERIVGRWIKERGVRDQLVLATKVGAPMSRNPYDQGLSRKHIHAAIDASLARLGVDYVDYYQVHFPDPETPIEETLEALNDLVHAGKVRYIGASNFLAYQLSKALWVSDKHGFARFEGNQPRYNLLYREIENEIVPLCEAEGLGLMVFNPLAGGFLTGRYQKGQATETNTRFGMPGAAKLYQSRYWQDEQFQAVERLREVVEPRGHSLTQVAITWILHQSFISSTIIGASRPEQVKDSLAAVDLMLDQEELEVCDELWYQLPRPRDRSLALR
jgi:1-deoxyxylulose-5-phosphate synthase